MFVVGEGGAGGEVHVFVMPIGSGFVFDPTHVLIGGGFDAGLGVVFGFEAGLNDFELEGADGSEQGNALHVLWLGVLLDDAFLQELFEAFAEALVVGWAVIVQAGEAFRDETRRFIKDDASFLAESVADAEVVVADDADDIPCVGFIDGLAILSEEALGVGEADGLAGAWVVYVHVPLEGAGDDTDKVDPVAMAGVHVGLDFKDES